MYKIISIVGARPQFIKTAALCRVINNVFSTQLEHIILHTGQHYDKNMSEIFFDELEIDAPTYNLGIHSTEASYPMETSVSALETILKAEKPDMVLVYGDTFSTLAGAIATENCALPLAHIEAGMRSFDMTMPEEINRIETDKRATYLFCATQTAIDNLKKEGIYTNNSIPYNRDNKNILFCGDIIYDHALYFEKKKNTVTEEFIKQLMAFPSYALVTIHRQQNTDDKERLINILTGLKYIADDQQHLVFPLHPRTQKMIVGFLSEKEYTSLFTNPFIHFIAPLSFLEMMYAEKHASMILTDSGGVQKESYFYQKPCIIFRNETEWTELIKTKCSILSDVKPENILKAFKDFKLTPPKEYPPLFGNGNTADSICREILNALKT